MNPKQSLEAILAATIDLQRGSNEQKVLAQHVSDLVKKQLVDDEKNRVPVTLASFGPPVQTNQNSPVENDVVTRKADTDFFGHSPHEKPEF